MCEGITILAGIQNQKVLYAYLEGSVGASGIANQVFRRAGASVGLVLLQGPSRP